MKYPDSLSGPPRVGKGCGPRGERMERGTLRLLLLEALQAGATHGYEAIKSIEGRANGQYSPSPGTVYPTLQLLEDEGNIRVLTESDRRTYEITDAGRAEIVAQAEKIATFWARFEVPPLPEASKREVSFLSDELEALGKTVWVGLAEEIEAGNKDSIRKIRMVVRDCHEQIRIALSEL